MRVKTPCFTPLYPGLRPLNPNPNPFRVRRATRPPRARQVVECLLHEGANVNFKDRWGQTALQEAVRNKRGQAVALLVKAGGKLAFDDPASHLCRRALPLGQFPTSGGCPQVH